MKKNSWGFDTRDLDKAVRPQNDFYHYVNGGWLKRNSIPPHEASWGSFIMLRYDTEKKLRALVTKLQNLKKANAGSPSRLVRDFYRSGLNMKRRNALGVKPLRPWLERIKRVKDVRSLVVTLAHLETIGGSGPFGVMVDQDMKESERYIIYLCQSGLGMPDRDYYVKSGPESVRVLSAYVKHLEALFALMGKTRAEAKRGRETVMRIETAIAKVSMTKEDLRDVDKTYHKMRVRALGRIARHIDWSTYFRIIGAKNVREVVVMQPKFLRAIDAMLASELIEDWKTYLTSHLVGGAAGYLTEKLEKQSFAFYGTALSGVRVMKPLWRRALRAVNGSLGEMLGKLYVQAYFGPDAKKKIVHLVADLFTAYEARIKGLDWMSSATKRRALKKLHAITRELGYPDKWRSYKGL